MDNLRATERRRQESPEFSSHRSFYFDRIDFRFTCGLINTEGLLFCRHTSTICGRSCVTETPTLAVLVAVWGCFLTGGKSVRNSGSCLVIFPLMVRAAYSSFGDATQQGTMLWASTCSTGQCQSAAPYLVDLRQQQQFRLNSQAGMH